MTDTVAERSPGARPWGSRLRVVPAVLLVAYGAFLAWALLAPTNTDQSAMVVHLETRLLHLGVPARLVEFDRLEVVMNAVIIMPGSFLGSWVFRRWTWRDWTAAAFLASSAVEITQALLFSGREASFSDVVANTAGALVGALLFAVTRAVTRAWRTQN